jgi:dienelactone hydrolase
MRINFYPICFIACLLSSMAGWSQATVTGTWGTLNERPNTPINEMIGGFIEVLPPGYDPNGPTRYPVLIMLEGQSQFGDGSVTGLQTLYGQNEGMLPDLVIHNKFPNQNYNFIVIIPQLRRQVQTGRQTSEQMASPTEVNDIINYTLQNYKADVNRIYLSGLSLGGGSTWNYAGQSTAYASRLAAIATFEAASNLWDNHDRVTNIANAQLPVWAFAMQNDHPFDTLSQHYIDSLDTHRPLYTAEHKITIYPSSTNIPATCATCNDGYYPDHDSWINALVDPTLYQWMLGKSRTLSQPTFATVHAAVDQNPLNLSNGSMILGTHGISFNGSTVTLTATAPTSGYSIDWRRVTGNGGNITDKNSVTTTVTDLKPGFYIYQLRVTDNSTGLIAVDNVSITVNAPPENRYSKVEAESFIRRSAGGDFTAPTAYSASIDEGPATTVGWFSTTDSWVEYDLTLPSAGTYALYYRYAGDYNPNLTPVLTVTSGSSVATKTLNFNYTWVTDSLHINLTANPTIRFQAQGWGFNYFELALLSTESPLPVKFVYFNSQCSGNGVNLEWKTAQEINSKNFDVQRSVDGTNWSSLSTVAAAGQSSSERSYHYNDNSGGGFYRVIENDLDGRTTKSSIVRSNCQSGLNEFSVSPNPVSGAAIMSVHLQQGAKVQWKIIDSKGAMMQQNQVVLPSGSSSIPLNLSNYAKGIYSISIYYNNEMKTIKLIKK